jgi:large subunit ribosomal protein L25
MKKHELKATKRTLLGKQVKNLRKNEETPGTVYGKGVENVAITVRQEEFLKVYKETGETGLIDLQVDGTARPVLIHAVQKDPVTNALLHIEFYQVNLKEKVHAQIPLVMVGTSQAVTDKIGVLLVTLDEVEVEALPAELPEHLEVDVSGLIDLNQELKVKDIHIPKGVELHTETDLTVVKISSLVQKEKEEATVVTEVVEETPTEGASTESSSDTKDEKDSDE